MASIWSPRERLALIERLAARPGADSESFFVAYGLGEAYRGPGRNSSKKTKINAALQAAADDGRTNEILDAIAKYVGEPEVEAEDPSHSPMPAPTDEAQAQLLQAVWDLLRRRSQWPTLQEVDYKLDREHELDVVSIAASLPDDLLMPPRLESLDPSQELKLTIAGVRACQGSEEDLKIFLDALRVAVEIEREFVPQKNAERPMLTAADLAERSRLPAANLPAKLARLGCLLAAEHWGWVSVGQGDPGQTDWQIRFDRRIRRLRNVTDLDDYWRITREGRSPSSQPATEAVMPTELDTIFLVHGHDDARYEVARYLEKIVQDTEAVILSEQANRGMTVIEKFEAHGSTASFAVVLLTPDDEGRAVGAAELQPRARQNVVFELGYFVGKLGRDRVVVLNKGGVEKPSDIAGVVYIDFPQSNWKDDLNKELRAAGFTLL